MTVSQNNDGSRTTYEIDGPSRKEVATTIGEDGKVKGLIRYDLDEAGHFQKGEVFGPAERFLFKTLYKYDNAGRLQEETQLTKENVMKNKLVYSYDALTGRQTGYSIYDAAGKLLGQVRTNAPRQASTPPPGKR